MSKLSNLKPSPLPRAILDTVVYADIFDYPLTRQQVHRYLTGVRAHPEAVFEQIDQMSLSPGLLRRVGQYIFLAGREKIIETRQHREKLAARLWPAALRYARLIARLPFVRMIAVTGSLTMNNVDESGDIDYLIVTAHGRLWLCRLLVLGVVRLASWQKINLCPNYLISERALEIPHHSLYAAHEFTQMVPLNGLAIYEQMRKQNPWVNDYLPNAQGTPAQAAEMAGSDQSSILQTLFEKILMTRLGARLEDWEMRRKIRKLSLENTGNPEAAFTADLCKGHSNRHSARTEKNLDERMQRLALKAEQ